MLTQKGAFVNGPTIGACELGEVIFSELVVQEWSDERSEQCPVSDCIPVGRTLAFVVLVVIEVSDVALRE